MEQDSTPHSRSASRRRGAAHWVVHEALLSTRCADGSSWNWFTPQPTVKSASTDGEETMTFRTLPRRCPEAAERRWNRPVASTTSSASRSDQGMLSGEAWAQHGLERPAT